MYEYIYSRSYIYIYFITEWGGWEMDDVSFCMKLIIYFFEYKLRLKRKPYYWLLKNKLKSIFIRLILIALHDYFIIFPTEILYKFTSVEIFQ